MPSYWPPRSSLTLLWSRVSSHGDFIKNKSDHVNTLLGIPNVPLFLLDLNPKSQQILPAPPLTSPLQPSSLMFVPCRFQTASCKSMFKYYLFNKAGLTILSQTATYPTFRSFTLNPIFFLEHLPPSNILCNLFIQCVYCLLSVFSLYDVNFMGAGMFGCFIS